MRCEKFLGEGTNLVLREERASARQSEQLRYQMAKEPASGRDMMDGEIERNRRGAINLIMAA